MTNDEIWLYKRSGSGTAVIPNPEGMATDDLEKIQIGDDIYAIPQPDLTNYLTSSDVGAAALSNSYNDLDNKPTIPTVPTTVSSFTNDAGYLVQSDLSGYVESSDLATVATSGLYSDLSGTPTIPVVNTEMTLAQYNQLTPEQKNDGTIRYITDASGGVVANELDDLDDVSITNPTDGQAILYDSQNDIWYNGNVGGGSGGIDYSTTEIDTGDTWDGKPIYAKMFKGTTGNSADSISVGTINGRVLSMSGWYGASYDNLLKAPITQGFPSSTGGGESNDPWYLYQQSNGATYIKYNVTGRTYEILLKYTKTA